MCFRVSIVVVAGPGEVTGYCNNTNKHNNQQGGGVAGEGHQSAFTSAQQQQLSLHASKTIRGSFLSNSSAISTMCKICSSDVPLNVGEGSDVGVVGTAWPIVCP